MYRRSIFTFIDILGFSDIVKARPPEEIKELLALLREEAKPDDETAEMFEMDFLTFSDCTIRSTPIESDSNKKFPTGILWNEILILVHLQYSMIWRGHFIRGAITIDDIYFDNETVFGPAIIEAYRLESKIAKHPRLVIDPKILALFESDPLLRHEEHDFEVDLEYMNKVIRQDADGQYFVDYLAGMMTEFDEPGEEFDFLDYHRDLTMAKLTEFAAASRVLEKYVWLANYHNTVVNEVEDSEWVRYGIHRDDYLIPTESIPIVPKPE